MENKDVVYLALACILFVNYLTHVKSKTIDDFPLLASLSCNKCYDVYAPICASDNKTYINECRLNCMNEKKKDKAVFKRLGPCILGQRRSVIGAEGFPASVQDEYYNQN